MKNTIVVFVVSTISTALAHAEGSNVNVYGNVDAGVLFESRTAGSTPAVSLGRTNSLHSGGISPSVLGLSGTEDLGGGYGAGFNLESHLNLSNGSGNDFGPLWARAANVSLTGPFGKFTLGQQMTPAIIAYAATDPRGLRESLSGLQPWYLTSAQNFGPNAANTNVLFACFAGNALSYAIDRGGVHASALYSVGEKPGSSAFNRVISLGASYRGPVLISASYHTTNWATSDSTSDRKTSFGAGYVAGPLTLKGNVLRSKTYAVNGAQLTDYRIYGVGLTAATSVNNTVIVAYYLGKNATGRADNKAKSLVVSDEYALSGRTVLYAQSALIDAGLNADAAVSVLGAQPVQGRKTIAANLGIRHSF